MASTTTLETVTSADGTPIAYERTGSGPPLVLVHGMAGDHTRWELFEVRAAFAEHCTVYAIDRRGRGESGDSAERSSAGQPKADASGDSVEYNLEREFEDVAAVVDTIDEPVVLLGHSYGATCALEAPLRTDNLQKLVLYEGDVPWQIVGPHLYSEEMHAEMEALLDDGENEQVLVLFLREVVELSPAQIDELRSAPSWVARVEAAHTLPREYRAPADYEFDAVRFEGVTTPTLLLVGSESPQWAKDATEALYEALPNSRIAVLEGQGHVAMNTAPDLFVDEVLAFIRGSDEADQL